MLKRRVGRPTKEEAVQYQEELEKVLATSEPSTNDASVAQFVDGDNYVEALSEKSVQEVQAVEPEEQVTPEPLFTDPEDDKVKEQLGHSTGLQDPYKDAGFTPAIESSIEQQNEVRKERLKNAKIARPAEPIDLENLDESMIMNMPEIKAVSFELIDMLNPKPKDKSIRFRWTNYKNAVAGNLGRLIALGYKYATPEDIDTTKYTLDPSMIEGTQIRYYDVVLLKINVIRLMQLYKSNIIRSVMKLGRAAERGKNEANRQFASDLASSPQMIARYNQAKMQNNGVEPIEFYTPGAEESAVIGK